MDNTKKELIEHSLDTLDGVLSNFTFGIPVLKMIRATIEMSVNFKNKRLLKKIYDFLNEVKDDEKELDSFMNDEVDGDKNEQKNGELLFVYIDNLDDLRKSKLIGKVLSIILRSSITNKKDVYFKFVHLVINSYYNDLKGVMMFRDVDDKITDKDGSLEDLFKAGFLSTVGIDGGTFIEDSGTSGGTIYQLNNFGKIIYKVQKNKERLLIESE